MRCKGNLKTSKRKSENQFKVQMRKEIGILEKKIKTRNSEGKENYWRKHKTHLKR